MVISDARDQWVSSSHSGTEQFDCLPPLPPDIVQPSTTSCLCIAPLSQPLLCHLLTLPARSATFSPRIISRRLNAGPYQTRYVESPSHLSVPHQSHS